MKVMIDFAAVPGAAEERLEVHNLACPIIEKQYECERPYLRGRRNAHGMRHLTLLVSTSDVMRLWRTKKSIRFLTMSSALV